MGNKSPKYLELVRSLPCCVSGMWPVSAHHPREGMGMSQKATDWHAIPLHYDYHQGKQGIHTMGTKAWRRIHGSELDYAKKTQELLRGKIKIPDEYSL